MITAGMQTAIVRTRVYGHLMRDCCNEDCKRSTGSMLLTVMLRSRLEPIRSSLIDKTVVKGVQLGSQSGRKVDIVAIWIARVKYAWDS